MRRPRRLRKFWRRWRHASPKCTVTRRASTISAKWPSSAWRWLAARRLATDVQELGVDLYSMSGHKIYAPKGIGALFVRKGTPLGAIQHGGHHERDRRGGTENVPGAVGLGKAAECAARDQASESARLAGLRDRLESGILARVPNAGVNG